MNINDQINHLSLIDHLKSTLYPIEKNTITASESHQKKAAAVLIPLVITDHQIQILFTKRTQHLHHHPGQVSFPGGRLEPSDKHLLATALRETEEEIGVSEAKIQICGKLENMDTISGIGFSIMPFVGVMHGPLQLKLDSFEVDEVFQVPIEFLMDHSNFQLKSAKLRGEHREFYLIKYQNYTIWGATAAILHNFIEKFTR